MFKVGDKVKRKPEHQVDNWPHGDDVLTIIDEDEGEISFGGPHWYSYYFDLVEPVDPVPQYSTITQHKVGPYCVTVVRKTDQVLIGAYEEANHVLSDPSVVLQECEEDYRDPEMSHEDMLERLRDRLVKIEGVTQIDIVGVNDGCGVRISLEG